MSDFVAVSLRFANCNNGANGGGFTLNCNNDAGNSWWNNGAALTLSLFGILIKCSYVSTHQELKYSYIRHALVR